MSIQIAIVEDSPEATNKLRMYLTRFGTAQNLVLEIFCFDNAEFFLDLYKPIYDIILMDILLTGINGMDAAYRLRKLDPTVTLIFVTNMAQYAVKGYEVNAFDFIVKPVSYSSLEMKLKRALKKINNQSNKEIVLTQSERIMRISISQIKYIEIRTHNLIYHTTNGNYSFYGSLKSAETELNDSIFVRCNSCYLVNLDYVRGIDGFTVTVGDDHLQISRAKRKHFILQLNNYLGGNL